MAGPTGQLCLKWNNHSIAFNHLLNKIYLKEEYSDATVLCQGKFYPVHQIVLSTCSEYFELMFKQCSCLKNKHPFIVVKDIHPEQMEALLNYMYIGEVNVPQDMLPELIKAAEVFKIKGLAVPDEEPIHKSSRKRQQPSPSFGSSKKNRRDSSSFSSPSNRINENNSTPSQQNIPSSSVNEIESKNIKEEPIDIDSEEQGSSILPVPFVELKSNSPLKEESFENFDSSNPMENYPLDDEGSWDNSQGHLMDVGENLNAETGSIIDDPSCNSAEVPWKEPRASGKELEPVQRNTEYSLKSCTFPNCPYRTYNGGHMEYHIRKHTGERPFKCPKCSYSAAVKSNLKVHIFRHHICNAK